MGLDVGELERITGVFPAVVIGRDIFPAAGMIIEHRGMRWQIHKIELPGLVVDFASIRGALVHMNCLEKCAMEVAPLSSIEGARLIEFSTDDEYLKQLYAQPLLSAEAIADCLNEGIKVGKFAAQRVAMSADLENSTGIDFMSDDRMKSETPPALKPRTGARAIELAKLVRQCTEIISKSDTAPLRVSPDNAAKLAHQIVSQEALVNDQL